MNVIIAGNSRLSDGQTVSGTEPNPEIFRFNAPLPRSLPMRFAISNPRLCASCAHTAKECCDMYMLEAVRL